MFRFWFVVFDCFGWVMLHFFFGWFCGFGVFSLGFGGFVWFMVVFLISCGFWVACGLILGLWAAMMEFEILFFVLYICVGIDFVYVVCV